VDRLAGERAYGNFEILATDEERRAFIGRIEAYFRERGVPVE
jgi:hypothetical protein